jgi:hypothetical protein
MAENPILSGTGVAGLRNRGAEFDHVWKNQNHANKPKRLVIIFPLASGSSVPSGAVADATSVDPSGATSAAMFEMYINPDQIQMRHPTRSQVIQTIGGAYIDSFGYGLPVGTIAGTFGWGKDLSGHTGLDRMGTLKALYYGWQQLTTTLATPCHIMLAGNDRTDNLNMLVHFGDLEISRSKSSPLTVNYSLPFTVLTDYNGPVHPQVIPPIGTVPQDGGTPQSGPGSDPKKEH